MKVNVSLRHVGIVVPSVSKYKNFLVNLGFEEFYDKIEKGSFVSKLVGISDVQIRVVKLAGSEGSIIEILEYLSHPDNLKIIYKNVNSIGISHIAITTQDIKKTLEIFKSYGGQIIDKENLNENGTAHVVYCRDFLGNLFELVEDIKQ